MSKTGGHAAAVLSAATVALGALFAGCATTNPPQTVESLEVERYMGLWYEIARFPVFFERGLVGVTAEYTFEDNGRIRIRNQGYKKSLDGKVESIMGHATIPDPQEPGKLRVRFDPFLVRLFPADYWIIELGPDYEYAVVSDPSRDVLWILSREPTMEEAQYQRIVNGLAARGFDTNKLDKTPQRPQ